MTTQKFPGIILLPALAVLLASCSLGSDVTPPPGSEQKPPQQATQALVQSAVYPIVPPDLINGYKIYNQECAQCHGVQGLGDGPQSAQLSVPAASLGLSDFARHYSPAEWYEVVSEGNMVHFMPAFSNLTDRQRWDVVAYAMDLNIEDAVVQQGKQLYAQNCADCHGPSAHGNGPKAASLSTQPTNLTDQSFMAQRSATALFQAITEGKAPDMPSFSNAMEDDERWALVGYLRSLTYASVETLAEVYPAPVNPVSSYPYPAHETYTAPVVIQTPLPSSTSEISPTTTHAGSVTVRLINGSGGNAPADVPVTLYGFDEMQSTYSETLTTGIDGVYTFFDVAMPQGRMFVAGTEYASGTYGSDIVTVDPAVPDLNLEITVFDTTTDVSVLTTDRVHILFDFTDPQIAQVVEVFIISNPSRQAVVAPTKGGTVVTFPLPEGYSNLQFQDGEIGGRYVQVERGFADTSTVNPGVGGYTVIFAFQLPYNRKLEFTQAMSLPTSAAVVMVPENGIKMVSDQLQDGGTLDYQGATYHKYNATDLISGSTLQFSLSGIPKSTAGALISAGPTQSIAIGLGAFGVVLVSAGLWLYRRNQVKLSLQRASGDSDIARMAMDVPAAPDDEDTLMDAIIALDDQYSAGNLPEEAYLERRAVLKLKLRDMERG